MTNKALVLSTDKNITVMPLENESCTTCSVSGCKKKTVTFAAKNVHNLDLSVGKIVILKASKKMQIVQGLVSLLAPVLFAVSGYFLSIPICSFFGKPAGEGAKALGVLISFLISAGCVFFLTRKFPMPGTPEIECVLENS